MKRGALLFLFLVVALPFSFALPVRAAPGSNRDACKAALALEERGAQTLSSREPCHRALQFDGMPEDMRNEVASLMSPAAHPSLDDLVLGALLADAAVRKASDQPWGYLARCDIARRTGSADTLEACLADLQRFGPNHAATKQALAFATEQSSLGTWLLRVFVLLGLLGTLVHALLRSRSRHRLQASNRAVTAALLIGAWSLLSVFSLRLAHAEYHKGQDHLSDFDIDDDDPEASIPSPELQNKKPLEFGYYLQDLVAKAEKAGQAGDHAAEARFYSTLTKAVPTTAYAPGKLCSALQATGDVSKAILACRAAITRKGSTAADYIHFVNVVVSSRDALPPLEEKELQAAINHLAGEAQLGALPAMLRCEVALRFNDTGALESCTTELARTAPKDPKTVSFQWALALKNHDRSAALQLIDRARDAGMRGDGLAQMEQATRAMTLRRLGRLALILAAMIGVAYALVRVRRELSRRRVAA